MLPFQPNKSRLWQKAAFVLVYSSTALVAVRITIFITFLVVCLLALNSNLLQVSYISFSLLLVFIIFEIFYKTKIVGYKVKPKPVSENSNLADHFSISLARRMLGWPFWDNSAQLLKVLKNDPKVAFVFNRAGVKNDDLVKIGGAEEKININELAELAVSLAEKEKIFVVDELLLLEALFTKSKFLQKLFFEKQLKANDLENIIHWSRNTVGIKGVPFWRRPANSFGLGLAAIWSGGWTLETEKYTKDLSFSNQLKQRYLVGREKEVEQLQEILLRSEKKNAILLGEPGIGKETIVYSLAQKSLKGRLPQELSYKRFLELDITAFTGSQGNIEERLKNILTEISHSKDVILYIPQIENISGALENGKLDISGLLLDYLKSSLQVIGTTSRANYHQFVENKPVFAGDFETVIVSEPSKDQTIQILEDIAIQSERKHKITITYSAIKKAAELSERYLVDKVLPGKAIELLDDSASTAVLNKKRVLEEADIEQVVTTKTNVPAGLAQGDEKQKLIKLEETLHKRVVGQDEAIKTIAQAVRRARTLNKDTLKPIGVFLFLGPTGVGKTETAKALAEVYFSSEDRIIRFDMNEFSQEASVYRLIGAPPGSSEYREGGQLTEAVRANPFNLILLDELEKAHPKVQEAFLGIFDEGVINDSSGRKISFTNTIIIGTSNAGAEFIREEIEKQTPIETLRQVLIEKLLREASFKPEFINRFDDVIVYKPLDKNQVVKVVELIISKLKKNLQDQDINLEVSPQVVSYLAEKGYDPTFGARPLQRIVQTEIEDRISQALLEGKLNRGSDARFNLTNKQITLE